MFVIGASGCVLFVNPAESGAHCEFLGSSTACGACLVANCVEEIDACCLDATCGGVITDVEACANQLDAHCKALQSVTDQGGAHRDLSACVVSHCMDDCAESLTDCSLSAVDNVNACSCNVDLTPNATPCTSVNHPTLRCCASEGWPKLAAADCECLAVSCFASDGACVCELSSMDYNNRPTTCTGGADLHCCADQTGSMCTCSGSPCLPTDTEMGDCTIDALQCVLGEQEVTSCSLRAP